MKALCQGFYRDTYKYLIAAYLRNDEPQKATKNMFHYTRGWVDARKQFMLGQLKSWCDEKVYNEFEKQIEM